MIIDFKNKREIYPHFDSGMYKNEWIIKDKRIQQSYTNGDKYIVEKLNYAILGAIEAVLYPYTESNKYLIGDYIIPIDNNNEEPLLITDKKENCFVLFSKEKEITTEIKFVDLKKVKLY